jgi:hypothetical protein
VQSNFTNTNSSYGNYTVTADGRVMDADGNPLLDADGNVVMSVDADGKLVDAQGNPVVGDPGASEGEGESSGESSVENDSSASKEGEDLSNNSGIIIGGVVAGVLVMILAIVAFCYLCAGKCSSRTGGLPPQAPHTVPNAAYAADRPRGQARGNGHVPGMGFDAVDVPYAAAAPPNPTSETVEYAVPEQMEPAAADDDAVVDGYMEPSEGQPKLYDANNVPGSTDHARDHVPPAIRMLQLKRAPFNSVGDPAYEEIDANDHQTLQIKQSTQNTAAAVQRPRVATLWEEPSHGARFAPEGRGKKGLQRNAGTRKGSVYDGFGEAGGNRMPVLHVSAPSSVNSNTLTSPLTPEQTYAESSSAYVEASLYVSANAAANMTPAHVHVPGMAVDGADYEMPSNAAATAPLTTSSTIYAEYAQGMDNGAAYGSLDTDVYGVVCARGDVQGEQPCTHAVGSAAAARFCANHTCKQAGCFNTKSSSDALCDLRGARFFLLIRCLR